MKMVRSLLLGSAAGLVAVAGAQAADLPVKAKPVQYVKICSLYGVGFYYIPGTDMCIKIGGWVRAEAAYGVNGASTTSYNGDLNNRFSNNVWWRIRGYITADSRNQTEYGTVRGYIAVGLSTNTTGVDNALNQFDANRAFIQWAGFTFGRAQSFFDFFPGAAFSYFGFFPQTDTGDGGKEVFGYTAQFGNGFSASLAAEARRNTQIVAGGAVLGAAVAPFPAGVGLAGGSTAGGSFTAAGSTSPGLGAYGGWQAPDIVANLRVDQAWGSAQIMGGLHEVNATYYANGVGAAVTTVNAIAPGVEANGHPEDKWGWVVGAGIRLNAPMIGQGDYMMAEVNYTQGALRYIFQNAGVGNLYLQEGSGAAYGIVADGVYGGSLLTGNATGVNLTTAWNVNAAYEHFWNPRWKTSLHGGYAAVTYGSQANAILCGVQGFAVGGGATPAGSLAVAVPGCHNDWNQWWIGSRTQWNVTKDFYMGVDVAYTKIEGATTPTGLAGANTLPANTQAISTRIVGSEDNWQVRFRVHRDFYP